jgi:hypothetical protein
MDMRNYKIIVTTEYTHLKLYTLRGSETLLETIIKTEEFRTLSQVKYIKGYTKIQQRLKIVRRK